MTLSFIFYKDDTEKRWSEFKQKCKNDNMSRYPIYLKNKEVPDPQLLDRIREMIKDGKSPNKIKEELRDVSLYIIRRYYTKIIR